MNVKAQIEYFYNWLRPYEWCEELEEAQELKRVAEMCKGKEHSKAAKLRAIAEGLDAAVGRWAADYDKRHGKRLK